MGIGKVIKGIQEARKAYKKAKKVKNVLESSLGTAFKKRTKQAEKKAKEGVKQLWRYNPDNKNKRGALSMERVNAELEAFTKEANKRLKRLEKSDVKKGEYYDDLRVWVDYEPKSAKEKRDKLYVLADFLSDDTYSTVKGLRRLRKAQERDAKNFVESMTDSSGKNYDRGMALQFLRYRYGQDGKTHSYKDIGENKEQIQAALLDWHEKGYPKK